MKWKRFISKLLVVVMALGIAPALPGPFGTIPAVQAASGLEFLPNGGFETVSGGLPIRWTSITQGSYYASVTDHVYAGVKALKIADPSANTGVGMRSAAVPITPGNRYAASVFAKDDSGHSTLYLEFWDANNQRVAYKTKTNAANAAWTELNVEDSAPATAVTATLLLYSNSANVGVSYFDAASLRYSPPIPELIPNGGFEMVSGNMPSQWTPLNSAIGIASATDQVLQAVYSVKLTDSSTTASGGLRSAKVPIAAGEVYRALVDVFKSGGNSFSYYLEFWDAANVRVSNKYKTATVSNAWTNISVEATAPDNAVSASVLLYSSGSNTGVAYFDQASLKQVPDMEFPLAVTGHPRLFFTAADIPELRARAQDLTPSPSGATGKELWDSVLGDANEYLNETSYTVRYYNGYPVTYPLPPVMPPVMPNPPGYTGSPTYPYWAAMAKALQYRLEALSLAYVITQNPDYAAKAKSYMLSLSDWERWTDTNYPCGGGLSCLDTAHLTLGVSAAYDVLYDLLTPEERSKVENALEQLGLEPLRLSINDVDNNADALRAAALGSGGAALLGKSAKAEKYLTRAVRYYDWYLDFRMNSGQTEGFNYTDYSVENMIRGIDNLTRTTGVQTYFEHPFFNDFIVRWSNYFLSPGGGGLATISDSGANAYSYGFFHNTMSIVARWLNNPNAVWYLTQADVAGSAFDRFLYFIPDANARIPSDWPNSELFDEMGWAAIRSGWTGGDSLLTLIGNNNKLDHSHYDQNSFTLATNGTFIARDPGYRDLSPGPKQNFTAKDGHSTIRVDGQSQSAKGEGRLQAGILSPNVDYMIGSAPGAYGNSLSSFDRHIVRVNDYYVMMDDLKASSPHTYDWMLYAGPVKDAKIDGTAASVGVTTYGNKFSYRHSGARMTAYTLGTSALPITFDKYSGAESYGYMVKVGSGAATADNRFLSVLKAEASPQPAGVLTGADLLNAVVSSSGDSADYVKAATADIMTFKADAAGDYIDFSMNVSASGTYSLSGYFMLASNYGQVKAYVDGQQLGTVFEGYSPVTQSAPLHHFGDIALSAGDHTIRMEVAGKHPSSGSYRIGIDEVRLLPAASNAVETDSALQAAQVSAAGVIGAKVNCDVSCSQFDYVLFKTGTSGSYTVEGITSDAKQSVVSRGASGVPAAFAMTGGTSLTDVGQTLLLGSANFDASFTFDAGSGTTAGVLVVEAAGSYSFRVPSAPTLVKVDGAPVANYGYDASAKLLTVPVASGRHSIEVR
ncbi:hypothetical protein FE783_15755 [Paenibacillus mesophilus]|uniref:heparinase II/III domain-containing protein n=1 Tax=Paenibacillus mesophilus TaxID=2582849 RepID=UPI00110EE791|nr:heparinase II/III family protein [Paenibacillus mesophilus]TMV49120.1 hypothetical protein FE783_15755 [Paenibacillus mesophilus]